VPAGTDVLINATSIGLYPDVSACPPIDFSSLSESTVVADVIPNPPRTPFLGRAAERGCRTIDGLGMLINQGRIGIQYWTGVDPDPTVMRSALEAVFAE
jgi:shikimate dehydrogenase